MTQEQINLIDPKLLDTLGFLNRLGIKKVNTDLKPDENGISKVYVTLPSINDFEIEGNYPYMESIDIKDFNLSDVYERSEFTCAILKELVADIFYGLAEDIMTDIEAQKAFYRIIIKSRIKVFYKIREEEWTVEKSIERADKIISEALKIEATSTLVRTKNRQQ